MIEQAQPQGEADVIRLPMTRRDIGDYLNLTTDGVGDASRRAGPPPHRSRSTARTTFESSIGGC